MGLSTLFMKIFVSFIILSLLYIGNALAKESSVAFLFTGDLHSRFEEHLDPFHLGGVARLKTAMDQRQKELSEKKIPVLRFDAGDCSEGGIYFNLGGGAASYEMLSLFGYDAVTLGNHDWYNGPAHLDQVLGRFSPHLSLLSANLNFNAAPDHPLKNKVKPYEIFYWIDDQFIRKTKDDLQYSETEKAAFENAFKVGVFGLATKEVFYEFYFKPVQIFGPLSTARQMVSKLRHENVDVVVLLSHLLDEEDVKIARMVPHIDVILGGHTHNRVIPRNRKPIVVEWEDEDGKYTTWIAKAGEFGQFLGEVQLTVDSSQDQKRIIWDQSSYDLHQIDQRYEEDSEVKQRVDQSKRELIEKYKNKESYGFDIFADEVAESEIDLVKSSATESYFGNLIANAIYEKTKSEGVEFSVNNTEFLAHGLFKGKIRSADIYQAFPVIFNPLLDRSWSIFTFEIEGKALKKAINTALGLIEQFFDTAHLQIIYDLETPLENKIVSLKVDGNEIVDDRVYKVAASEGIVKVLERMKDAFPELTISNKRDTGIEVWMAIRDYMKKESPLLASNPAIRVSGRMRTVQPDLAVLSEEMVVTLAEEVQDNEKFIDISGTIHNFGYGTIVDSDKDPDKDKDKTEPTRISFYYDKTPESAVDFIDPFKPRHLLFPREYKLWNPVLEDAPESLEWIGTVDVPPLAKDESHLVRLRWNVGNVAGSFYPYVIYALLNKTAGTLDGKRVEESNLYNNKAYTFVSLP